MNRSKVIALLALSAGVGALSASFAPESLMLPVLLTAFILCIACGWILVIQNRGLNLNWLGLFFPMRPFVVIAPSKFLMAFAASAAFAVAACLILILKVTHA